MKITVTYDVDEEMIETIDETLSFYEPSDFEHKDDRDIFLADIADILIDDYGPLILKESIIHMLEEYLEKKGWIEREG